MTNYDVFREFDAGLTDDDLAQAVERSGAAIEEMRAEGTDISYLGSEVFCGEDDLTWATICRYDADSEATVREHASRAELPVRTVLRRSMPLPGISPHAGVVPKAA